MFACPFHGVSNPKQKEKTMKPREISKCLEVSTAHISEKDRDLLNENDTFGLVVHQYEYGYLIFTQVNRNNLSKEGFSNAFINLITEAVEGGCDWIRLDSINPIYDNLETFDW